MRVSFRSAATRPTHLTVLGVAIAAGLLIAFWLLPAGVLAYLALVALTMLDPSASVVARRRIEPPRGTAFEAQLVAIRSTQAEIVRSVAAARGPLASALGRVAGQVNEIVEEAYVLATKGQTIVEYLQSIKLGDLNGQLADIERKIRKADDPVLRKQYEETRSAVADRLRNAQALGAYRERIIAQLDNIRANLDNVLAETVRLRAAPTEPSGLSADPVSSRLADVRADMDALGQVLDTALSGVA